MSVYVIAVANSTAPILLVLHANVNFLNPLI